jgi:hypothetical protein
VQAPVAFFLLCRCRREDGKFNLSRLNLLPSGDATTETA